MEMVTMLQSCRPSVSRASDPTSRWRHADAGKSYPVLTALCGGVPNTSSIPRQVGQARALYVSPQAERLFFLAAVWDEAAHSCLRSRSSTEFSFPSGGGRRAFDMGEMGPWIILANHGRVVGREDKIWCVDDRGGKVSIT
jgi:hypothetical protein